MLNGVILINVVSIIAHFSKCTFHILGVQSYSFTSFALWPHIMNRQMIY